LKPDFFGSYALRRCTITLETRFFRVLRPPEIGRSHRSSLRDENIVSHHRRRLSLHPERRKNRLSPSPKAADPHRETKISFLTSTKGHRSTPRDENIVSHRRQRPSIHTERRKYRLSPSPEAINPHRETKISSLIIAGGRQSTLRDEKIVSHVHQRPSIHPERRKFRLSRPPKAADPHRETKTSSLIIAGGRQSTLRDENIVSHHRRRLSLHPKRRRYRLSSSPEAVNPH